MCYRSVAGACALASSRRAPQMAESVVTTALGGAAPACVTMSFSDTMPCNVPASSTTGSRRERDADVTVRQDAAQRASAVQHGDGATVGLPHAMNNFGQIRLRGAGTHRPGHDVVNTHELFLLMSRGPAYW